MLCRKRFVEQKNRKATIKKIRFDTRYLNLPVKNYKVFIFAPAMTQEQLKDMRDRVVVLRRFL